MCCARWSTCDETNNMKAQLNVVTHEMCRKREKERERPNTCSIFFLWTDSNYYFLIWKEIFFRFRTVINGTLVASKGTVIESTRTKCVNLNLLYLKNRLCCRKWERVNWSEQITPQIQVNQFEINESILLIFNYHSNLDLLCAKDPRMCASQLRQSLS